MILTRYSYLVKLWGVYVLCSSFPNVLFNYIIHLLIVLTKKNHLLIVIPPPKFVLHYMLPIAIYNLHLFTSIEIPTLFLSISHTLTFLCPPTFIPSPLVLPHIHWSLSPLARYNNVCENSTKGTHRYVGFPKKSIS